MSARCPCCRSSALGVSSSGWVPPEAAVEHDREQEALLEELGIGDADLSPAAELVEAYLRLGRPEDAASRADALEARARAKGQPWSLARAARCRALLVAEGEMEHPFVEAMDLHVQAPDAFEGARTRLACGGRLRRARKRVRAREELRTALDAFDRLGAAWSDLARVELASTGETAGKRDPSTLDDLTPQELQIGLLRAEGRTTREAAAVSLSEDDRVPPSQRLSPAGDPLPRGARAALARGTPGG